MRNVVRLSAIAVAIMVVGVMPVTAQDGTPTRAEFDALQARVEYLESFHPPKQQVFVFDADTEINTRMIWRPGDTVEFRNGAQLMFGPGGSLDAQGTPTSTWSKLGTVQNLDRDMKVFGAGDIMFAAGSGASTIRFVEFDLQPTFAVDHYPLHWHKAGDGSRGTLVEGVVVKNSTNRCLVPHGSHGITIRDTICSNITNDAIFWNKVGKTGDPSNATLDLVMDRILVDGVHIEPGANKYRNHAFILSEGLNLSLTNSVARNVAGTSHSGGYYWSAAGNLSQVGNVWTFRNNTTVNAHACAWTWQNGSPVGGDRHRIEGLTCRNTKKVGYGAYNMVTEWTGIDAAPTVKHQIKSVNTIIRDSSLGVTVFASPAKSGPVLIEDSKMVSVTFSHSATAKGAQRVVINRSGVTCADVVVNNASAGTTLTIDGKVCF